LPITNPQNLAGWNFRGAYGSVNPFEGHAGWSGVNTVTQPEAHMNFADLPGHGAPYEPGPYEGQEYTIVNSSVPATNNFNLAIGGAGGANHIKLRYDGPNAVWRISG
jgi:hypothetical protein